MLTPKQLEAALLVAQDKLTIPRIAELVGVSPRTINTWKTDEDFKAEVARQLAEVRKRLVEKYKHGIGDRDRRLYRYNDRWRRLQAVIEQRAKDPQFKDAPGGRTGLLTVTYKTQTSMDYSGEKPARITELVPEYAVDTGLLASMLDLEEQAAIELGEWKAKPSGEDSTLQFTDRAVLLAKVLTVGELEDLKKRFLALQPKTEQ